MGPFLCKLLDKHESWRHLPAIDRTGDGWRGAVLAVPPPPGSDSAGPLDIEEIGGEITISLDYSHIHMPWPPCTADAIGNAWTDAMAMIDEILGERVLSLSGWIDDRLRAGSLQDPEVPIGLLVPNLQRLRVRSWMSTFDRDEVLGKDCGRCS